MRVFLIPAKNRIILFLLAYANGSVPLQISVSYNSVNNMYDNLKSLGISNPQDIDRYTLRQEANNDILKSIFAKIKGNSLRKV